MTPVSDLNDILKSLEPELNDGEYAYVVVPHAFDFAHLTPLATFREREGTTLVIDAASARNASLEIVFLCAWITLTVNSDLEAVGLTATFAHALAAAGVSCNVIAGVYHDHIFVPVDQGPQAMRVLQAIQSQAVRGSEA
ncbi:ACT domain-containing protein [Pandoraea anhela]|uniref:Uncharacterized protein n=1 Tax=Pandoraea anhela TaxID=2508295 RepID=A0A5E4W9L3_9BURK|nr:ACT domain-containing protein [Pandoraea anhela]VVE21687.1 hypothetical protein PAN31108_03161 [Pandoraea anhela]